MAGMRLNMVDASYEPTENSILESVIRERRVTVDSRLENPNLSNLNQTSASSSIFFDEDKKLGFFNDEGISVYIPSNLERDQALQIIDQVNKEGLISDKN